MIRANRDMYKFAAGYFVFYMMICFSLPAQTTGIWLRNGIFCFFQAFLPYLLLLRLFPYKKVRCMVFLGGIVSLNYSLGYGLEQLFRPVSIDQYIDETYPLLMTIVLYGVLFFFVRYAGLKAIAEQQQQIGDYEAMLDQYRRQLPQEILFKQLEKIEELVNNESPEALPAIVKLSDQLRGVIY